MPAVAASACATCVAPGDHRAMRSVPECVARRRRRPDISALQRSHPQRDALAMGNKRGVTCWVIATRRMLRHLAVSCAAIDARLHIFDSGVYPVAAPWPIPRMLDPVGPHRAQVDVTTRFQKVGIANHHDGVKPPLKQMADLPVPPDEGLRVHDIDMPHQPRRTGLLCLQHEVVVIAHQAIGKQDGVDPIQPLLDYRQTTPRGRYRLRRFARAGHHAKCLVDSVFELESGRTEHRASVRLY